MRDDEIIMTQAQIDEIESKWPAHEASWEDVHNLVVEVMRLRKRAQELALYAFNHHGDDANLYNGLADLGGVDIDGKGWIPPAAAPAAVRCQKSSACRGRRLRDGFGTWACRAF
jgi:hypothetical protein